ncbi:protein kinase family protein [Aestuariimicrobium sp. Y1814]|uniref:protein kinase family protein n=1 Tax=Aestuariimicrobium sp. Y1814 TaxID=3418742 RepID=UPI003DA6E6C7
MHHDGFEEQSSRSRWSDPEAPSPDEVFDQDEYTAPVWDSWSDSPDTFPEPASPEPVSPAPSSAFTRVAQSGDMYGRPPAATSPDVDDESTQTWTLDDELLGPEPTTPGTPDQAPDDPDESYADDLGTDEGDDDEDDDEEDTSPITEELSVGLVVTDRYRLEERIITRGHTHSWRAFDQKLSRPVMLHLLEANRDQNSLVLDAARRSAIATDSRFLRVLDAINAHDVAIPGVGACIVSEYVPGQSLEALLASGPLSGTEAAWVVRELADALVPMHAKGLFHQQLNPDTVVVTATGNVKIVGFLIEEAMYPGTDRPHHDVDSWAAMQEADVRALGQLLYATLVNRWPAPHSQADRLHWGMAAAPMDGHGWLTPRQVRAGVAPALDVICDQVLSHVPRTGAAPITTAAQLEEALSRVLGTADASADLEHRVRYPVVAEPTGRTPQVASATSSASANAAPATPAAVVTPPLVKKPNAPLDPIDARVGGLARPRPAPRHWLTILAAVVALTLVGSLIAVGINNRRGTATPPSSSTATQADGQPVSHPFATVDDFDPEADGGNNEENPNQVALAHDGDPATAWTTLRYIGNPALGGLKPGVGLVIDLGQVVDVGRVTLQLQGSPSNVQVLLPTENPDDAEADPPMTSVEDWTVLVQQDGAGESLTLTPPAVAKTRYLLVYLTSLPSIGGDGYRGAIAEMEVFDR